MKKQSQISVERPAFVFRKRNYVFMFIGITLIALGFFLMAGGGSTNPEVWNPQIFNFQRIRLAPTLILIGLGTEVYAIMLDPNKNKVSKK